MNKTLKYVGGKPEVEWNEIKFKKGEPVKVEVKDTWVLPFNILEVKEEKLDGDSSTTRVSVGKKRTNKLQ